MAQLDGSRRRYADEIPHAPPSLTRNGGDTSIPKSSAISRFASFTPRAPTIGLATVEQLLRGGGQNKYSQWKKGRTTSCCNSMVSFDPEEYHSTHLPKSPSVLARVKEKATLWRHTLSVNRHSTPNPNITPSWGVSLDDIDDPFFDDDPDHHDPPTYESEQAPEALKEAAKQDARALIVAESHIIMTDAPEAVDQDLEKGISMKVLSEMIVHAMSPANAATTSTAFGVVGKVKDVVNSLLQHDQVISSLTSVIKISTSHFSQPASAATDDVHEAANKVNRESTN